MNQMYKLLAENRGKGTFKAVSNAGEDTIYLYDMIVSDDYYGGVSATSFVQAINGMSAPTIHMRINSPGGDVFAARAIEQAIREHPSQVVAHIDGYAASAASYIALAADEVRVSPGSFYMIHKAWMLAMGNADDLLHAATLLEKVDESLVKTYAAETGQDEDQIRTWMAAETWFSADEAVEYGFADSIADGESVDASVSWSLSAYDHAPKQADPEPVPDPIPDPEIVPDTDSLLRAII